MVVRANYEVSSEGAVRHWEVTKAKLENATPTETQPAAVVSQTAGTQLTGTVLRAASGDAIAIVDFTCGMVYQHKIRNVLTYSAGAEATWAALDEGDAVYYDGSSTMPADVFLSTSPLDKDGAANPLFGHIVLADQSGTLPVGGATASTNERAVMQRGAAG